MGKDEQFLKFDLMCKLDCFRKIEISIDDKNDDKSLKNSKIVMDETIDDSVAIPIKPVI